MAAMMPTLALGSTCKQRVTSRFTKAIALCRVTCFLRLVSITSRHCSTMMMSSFGAPEEMERVIFNGICHIQIQDMQ